MGLLHLVHTHTPFAVCMQSMCGTEAGQKQHGLVMQFNMKLLFQLRELLLKIQYCLIKVILIFNLQFIPY